MVPGWFTPLRFPGSPLPDASMLQEVVESPTLYEAPAFPMDVAPVVDLLATLHPQESQVSSVQWSPNNVRADFDLDTIDVFPVFTVSPDTDVYVSHDSPISSPGTPDVRDSPKSLDRPNSPGSPNSPDSQRLLAGPADDSRLDDTTGSYESALGSPATSLGITVLTAHLDIVEKPVLPATGLACFPPDPSRMLDWTQNYPDFIPPVGPVHSVVQPPLVLSQDFTPPVGSVQSVVPPPVVLSQEGLFDVLSEPGAAGDHLLLAAVDPV